MSCRACAALRQILVNVLFAADQGLNALLGGDPRETVSRRTARARAAGSRAAARFCWILTGAARLLGSREDHCTWALDGDSGSAAAEVWHWSPPAEGGAS